MCERRAMSFGGNLFAQLEDGHADRHDEAEERELQGIPGLQTEHTDGQWDQSHRFQQDEHEDGDDDFFQLRSAGLVDGAALAELDVEGDLIVLDVARAHLHSGVKRQLEGHIVRGQVVLHPVEEGDLATSGHFLDGLGVTCNFH